MTLAARLAFTNLVRAPSRTLLRVVVLVGATGLLGSMILFVGHSMSTMTSATVRSVPLDWQGPANDYKTDATVATAVSHQAGIAAASATATAPLAGATHLGSAGLTTTGSGAVLAVPPDYQSHFQTFRMLQGALAPGGVILDQQMAATLQARIGDTVTLRPGHGGAPQRLKVSGVALVTAADTLFAPLNPQSGSPSPAQPPANIAVMPMSTFRAGYAKGLHSITAANIGSSAVPGALDGIQWQVQAQVDPTTLTASPSNALKQADQTRNRIQRSLPGRFQFVDNLSDKLTTASGDALYGAALYIMLALPGALIALGLAYLAALGTVESDRRELALLRARGARRRDVFMLAAIESVVLGLIGGALGTVVAAVFANNVVSGGVNLTFSRVAAAAGACIVLAILGAAAARIGSVASVLRSSVADARRGVRRERAPLWQRLGLDFIALIVSGLIYWLTASTGFSAVVNPDSNPTLSLAVYMFFAPALLWIGATLLLVRLRGRVFKWALRGASGERAHTWRGLLLASAGRRSAAINRGLVVVGLLLAFGVTLGIFAATYDQQSAVDAQLTLGADVTVTAPPGAVDNASLSSKVASVPGVRATSALEHSYAYVGPDLQDTFAIEPNTISKATTLRNSYFIGSTADQALQSLRSRRDAILVSKETIADYGLNRGDVINLGVLDHATGVFVKVPFHVAGIVQEFPSAPRDSFMVTNLAYVHSVDHGTGPNVVFASTSGSPPAVAAAVARATASSGTLVKDIKQQTTQTGSSIAAVDLSGIRDIEEVFAIALAAAAMALFSAIALSERRAELATMAAVGAPLRRIGAFLWSEALLVIALGVLLAAGLGLALSEMLVAMLQHVFDPPPDHLAVPWGYLAGLIGAAAVAAILAAGVAALALRRLPLGSVLREQ